MYFNSVFSHNAKQASSKADSGTTLVDIDFSVDDVLQILSSLDVSKAMGIDCTVWLVIFEGLIFRVSQNFA